MDARRASEIRERFRQRNGNVEMIRLEKHVDKQADKLIEETVEEVMLNIFGKRLFERFLRIMREKYSLKIDEVPKKPQVFSEALHEIFGANSIIIEDLIIESLYVKMGLESRWKKNYKFSDYMANMRKLLTMWSSAGENEA